MFGNNPSFTISGRLSYSRIAELFDGTKKIKNNELNIYNGRSPNYALARSTEVHPTKKKLESAMCLRMYNTYILIYFKDGTTIINDYDSGLTRGVLCRFGPVAVFKDARIRARCTQRWNLHGWHDPLNWPMNGPIIIRKDGTVHGMIDTFRRVRPNKKKERREICRAFREAATSRVVLGEFGELIKRESEGYSGSVPINVNGKTMLFNLLLDRADHDQIVERIQMEGMERIGPAVFGRRRRFGAATYNCYDNPTEAGLAVIGSLLRFQMADSGYQDPWYENYQVKYPPVQTRSPS